MCVRDVCFLEREGMVGECRLPLNARHDNLLDGVSGTRKRLDVLQGGRS